jgi:hypothetical protein
MSCELSPDLTSGCPGRLVRAACGTASIWPAVAVPPLTSSRDMVRDRSGHVIGRLMFPMAQDRPSGGAQKSRVSSVALDVARELCAPVMRVSVRWPPVLGASVPETPVDEHYDALRSEDDVRRDANAVDFQRRVLPKPQSSLVKQRPNDPLGARVSPAVPTHLCRNSRRRWLGVRQGYTAYLDSSPGAPVRLRVARSLLVPLGQPPQSTPGGRGQAPHAPRPRRGRQGGGVPRFQSA